MLALDNVELEFTEEALAAVSEKQLNENWSTWITSIIEESLIDIMYDVPSTSDVAKVVVTAQTINEEIEPEMYDSEGNLLNGTKTSA